MQPHKSRVKLVTAVALLESVISSLKALLSMPATLFSLGGFINAVFAKSFDDISIVPTFVLTPLTYLGGVFYSIDNLSPLFQTISLFNPIVYMVNSFRYGILGVSDVSVSFSLLFMTLVTMAMYVYALHLLKSGRGMKE